MNQRNHAALIGLLIGDAVGVPYEFKDSSELPPFERIDMTPPPGFPRSHASVEPGTWSDDGAHALALWDSLHQCGHLDLADLGARLVDWEQTGSYAVDGRVFDIGIQTSTSIGALIAGTPPEQCGGTHERSNGNGSLMRVLPLALWHNGPDTELIALARRQSLITHAHLRSQLCCALYVVWVRRELQGHPHPWADAVRTVREACASDDACLAELTYSIDVDRAPGGTGSGYVVECLHSARWALERDRFEDVIRAAISLGNDTDTTAAVAGGIAGLRHGRDGIPTRWLQGLRGRVILTRVLGRAP